MSTSTYWCGKGKYQAKFDEVWKRVPAEGKASDPRVELLRVLNKVYYDLYNNGNDTWYAMARNNVYDPAYAPPHDAPEDVKEFFMDARLDYEFVSRKVDALDRLAYAGVEDVAGDAYDRLFQDYRICTLILEEVFDQTVKYVATAPAP